MKIDAVILAKSSMWGNFCVAGIDIDTGKWVRFVSYEKGEPLADYQLIFVNSGGSCEPLDVGRIGIAQRIPRRNHTEDCMIKYSPWLKIGKLKFEDVLKIHPAEDHKFIFGNANNYITEYEMQRFRFNYSLILIHVEKLEIFFENNFTGNIRGRANFIYNGVKYRFIRVTDTGYEPDEQAGISKEFRIMLPRAYLVMSMPVSPFQGRYYKLIAKIFVA